MTRWPKSVVRLARKAAAKAARKRARPLRPDGRNENEARFDRMILGGRGVYEPCRIEVTSVNRRVYTPDFETKVALPKGGTATVYAEVKGGYRLQSEDRARLAWEIAAERFAGPGIVFAWARWVPKGRLYECEAWARHGERVAVGFRCRTPEDFAALVREVAE